jgi:hypothetical protein
MKYSAWYPNSATTANANAGQGWRRLTIRLRACPGISSMLQPPIAKVIERIWNGGRVTVTTVIKASDDQSRIASTPLDVAARDCCSALILNSLALSAS